MPVDLWLDEHRINGQDDIVEFNILVCKAQAAWLFESVSVEAKSSMYTLSQAEVVFGIFCVE
jgi:hypothetical protein